MTSGELLAIAEATCWPRVTVRVPGMKALVPVDPTPEAWERFAAWFALDEGALRAARDQAIAWEVHVRSQLVPAGAMGA